jgi:(1->4)-alpha-D-glucan 1-alpha-D-glucosylmutase
VVAYSRGKPAAVVTVVDRRAVDPSGGWAGTTVALPPGRWTDRLGGGPAGAPALQGEVDVAGLLGSLPAALLVGA